MAVNEVHLSDIGTVFEITFKDGTSAIDISAASTKQILFKKPDATTLTKSGTFTSDGTDGKLKWVTISGDLDTTGKWEIQGYVVLAGGEWHTDVGEFTVYANIA